MSSAPRSSASFPTSSTRAATATASPASMRRRPRVVPQASVEPFLFWRRDVNLRSEIGHVGDLSQTTMGVRLAGKLPARLDYGVEMAMQRGSLGTDSVSAWAGTGSCGRSPGAGAVQLTGGIQLRLRRRESDRRRARHLRSALPDRHDKYGLADQVGWRNIHHLRAGVELTPSKATADHRRTITRGGSPRSATRSTRPAARCSPACRPAPPTARRTGARRPGVACR